MKNKLLFLTLVCVGVVQTKVSQADLDDWLKPLQKTTYAVNEVRGLNYLLQFLYYNLAAEQAGQAAWQAGNAVRQAEQAGQAAWQAWNAVRQARQAARQAGNAVFSQYYSTLYSYLAQNHSGLAQSLIVINGKQCLPAPDKNGDIQAYPVNLKSDTCKF